MRDIGSPMDDSNACAGGYVGFALDVIEHLARRRRTGGEMPDATMIDRLIEAVTAPSPAAPGEILEIFRAARITDDQAVDSYIPECARRLGRDWEHDRLSFAAVTLGAGRLQGLLHQLTRHDTADSADPESSCTVLLVVPPGEQHTLGVSIVAAQLRRQGISVCLRHAPATDELALLLERSRFDAALITLGSEDRLEICAKLVKTLADLSKGNLRIAVGGPVGDVCRGPLLECGASLVTSDLSAVIAGFGLEERRKARRAG